MDGSSEPTEEDKKIMEEIKNTMCAYVIFVNKRDIAVDNIDDTMEISKKFFLQISERHFSSVLQKTEEMLTDAGYTCEYGK